MAQAKSHVPPCAIGTSQEELLCTTPAVVGVVGAVAQEARQVGELNDPEVQTKSPLFVKVAAQVRVQVVPEAPVQLL
jgi:hypothetical protein